MSCPDQHDYMMCKVGITFMCFQCTQKGWVISNGSPPSFRSGSVSGPSINLEKSPYVAMHHFISNNHSYSKPLIPTLQLPLTAA